ncbi:MAG: hypothetical protein NTW49_08785 [Bacteroidia bacterium]|nr:hypothetical protein [Bacteroidia bacterium]
MPLIQGVNIAAPVVPYSSEDVYPSHLAIWGKGGYRTVTDITERDGIKPQRLELYMLVCTESDGKMYRLVNISDPLTPQNWEEVILNNTPLEYPFENQTMIQIEHNQDRLVNVRVLNTVGNPVEADVQLINHNTVTIGFSEVMSGTIIIN